MAQVVRRVTVLVRCGPRSSGVTAATTILPGRGATSSSFVMDSQDGAASPATVSSASNVAPGSWSELSPFSSSEDWLRVMRTRGRDGDERRMEGQVEMVHIEDEHGVEERGYAWKTVCLARAMGFSVHASVSEV